MAQMSETAKARLREINEKRRKETILAKDYDVADWLVILDKVKEDDPKLDDTLHTYWDNLKPYGRTLRWVPKPVVEALTSVLPYVEVRYRVGPHKVTIAPVFPSLVICRLIRELKLNLDKYTRPWSWDQINMCKNNTNE